MIFFAPYFLGTIILGVTCGVVGVFAFMRNHSLLADAVAHASLPGVGLMFLFTQSKNMCVLSLGAMIVGCIVAGGIVVLQRITHLKRDSILGIMLSVFFGIGLMILSYIQRQPIEQKGVLSKYLFGDAALMLNEEVMIIAVIGMFVLLCIYFFFKEFLLFSFDPIYCTTSGYSASFLDSLLTFLLVLTIIIGLQTVGVVLISTLIVAPATAARQWTSSPKKIVGLSAFFGALAACSGSILSSSIQYCATGPTIVICLSLLVLISLFFAPHRGLFFVKKSSWNNI